VLQWFDELADSWLSHSMPSSTRESLTVHGKEGVPRLSMDRTLSTSPVVDAQ